MADKKQKSVSDHENISHTLPPKLIAPRLRNTLPRIRLHDHLDQLRHQHAAIWISAPAGSGKTTLAGDYLARHKLRSIWYQVDEGDNDIASFFHYLGLAAGKAGSKRVQPLPHLTPEYLAGLTTFARRYFEALAQRLKPPFVIVLDNYQELAADSPLQELLAQAIELLPPDITLMIISRVDPTAHFARLRANGHLSLLDWDALRLTAEESAGVAQLRGFDALDHNMLQKLHTLTDGWAAGLTLALERVGSGLSPRHTATTPQAIFDYFAAEIFDRSDAPVHELLLCTAFLPHITIQMARQLSGNPHAGQILADLQHRNYFTYRHDARGEAQYRYHPLFREFLHTRAISELDKTRRHSLILRSADLLQADGCIEDAAALFIEIGEWQAIILLVRQQARQLLAQGRGGMVEGWLKQLPATLVAGNGWLLYWLGVCRLSYDPVEARGYFEKAYLLFEERKDIPGIFLVWASIIDTFQYEWGCFRPVDRWLAIAENLLATHPEFSSPEIEARVAIGMFNALTWRKPQHPDLPMWAEKVTQIMLHTPNLQLQMMLGSSLLFYHSWSGDNPQASVIIHTLKQLRGISGADPLTQGSWFMLKAMHGWLMHDHEGCVAAVEEGVALADRTGVRLLAAMTLAMGCESSMGISAYDKAENYLHDIAALNVTRLVDRTQYQHLSASVAWGNKDYQNALNYGEYALKLVRETGYSLAQSIIELAQAITLFDMGRHEDAALMLELAQESAKGHKRVEFCCKLQQARFRLAAGDEKAGLGYLREAMALGARQGYLGFMRWDRELMSMLCATALKHGIEYDYVRKLITHCSLRPASDETCIDPWPWPVRIYTLGRFDVEISGKPLVFSGRVQQKPLDLLKAIIIMGDPEVATAAVIEELWPQSRGKAGDEALAIALHRLRTLLGVKDAIILRNNRLSLNPELVWLDLAAFERLTEHPPATTGVTDATAYLFELYRGQFLAQEPDEPWLWPCRERLRSRLLRYIMHSGKTLMEQQNYAGAISLYERGLDVDALAEALYSSLMNAHIALGQHNEALSVYGRCEKTLGAVLGVRPSAETEALYLSLRSLQSVA